jgi:Sigma-70 region 2
MRKPLSEETRARMSEAAKRRHAEGRGAVYSPEARAKLREAIKRRVAEGQFTDAAYRARMREAIRRPWAEGRGNSPASRAKASQSLKRRHAEGRFSYRQLHTAEVYAKRAATLRISPRAREQRAYVIKLRRARARARWVSVSSIFDEGKVSELIVRWQRTGEEEILASIMRGTLELIDSTIRTYSPSSPSEFAEVRSEVVLKLASLLPKYDPARGRVFSFFVLSIKNFLINRFRATVRRRSHEVLTDFSVFEETGAVAPPEIRLESEEFEARLRELLRPQGWQWRWRWQSKGKLPVPEWQPEWRWKLKGKIAA